MKQTPMSRRKSGLKPSGSLKRGKGLKRAENGLVRKGSLARFTPLPTKPTKPKVREGDMPKQDLNDILAARSGGWCEWRIPGHCLGRATNKAHRKPEGQGGLRTPSNLVNACGMGNNHGGCHQYQESQRTESYENGRLVRRGEDHRLRPVRMWHKGVEGEYLLDDAGRAVLVKAIREAS